MLDKHAGLVSPEAKDKILGLNCVELFNLPAEKIAAASRKAA